MPNNYKFSHKKLVQRFSKWMDGNIGHANTSFHLPAAHINKLKRMMVAERRMGQSRTSSVIQAIQFREAWGTSQYGQERLYGVVVSVSNVSV